MNNKIGVYFLTDMSYCRSYIGYSTSVSNRYRCHSLKLKASAKATKRFDNCILIAKIEGFPSKKTAMSYEFYSRIRRLNIRKGCLKLDNCPHKRLEHLFAPLLHEKFKKLKKHLIIYVQDPYNEWSTDISEFYKVEVSQLKPPFYPTHINNKKRFID